MHGTCEGRVGSCDLKMAHLSKIWTKNTAIIAGLVGFIGLALYPVVVSPAINPRKWRKDKIIFSSFKSDLLKEKHPCGTNLCAFRFLT